ncbi:MAG: response regulator transcription factor [Nitrospirota bacterium]
MKVLLVEDEKDLADVIKQGLEENAFSVEVCNEGEEGLFMAENYPYDAIVLDIMLPVIDGFTILDKLRSRKIKVPVLVLTARGGMGDKVKGLDKGADDYLVKPFEFPELVARLKAIIRRHKGEASPIISIDDLTIDINSRTVTRGDREIRLSSREYKILVYLALNKGRVLSREQIAEYIYDPDYDHESNIVDVYINYLRNKVDKGFENKLIRTVRGEGYTLKGNK